MSTSISQTPIITTSQSPSDFHPIESPHKTITLPVRPRPSPTPLSSSSLPLSINHNSHNTPHNNLQTFFNNPPFGTQDYEHIIESCTSLNSAKQIHCHYIKSGFNGHEFLQTKLLKMYGRFGCLKSADLLFEKMPLRSIYSWVGLITVYGDLEMFEEALLLFQQMLIEGFDLEFFVFPVVLKACGGFGDLDLVTQLHGFVIKKQFVSNVYVSNALIDVYGKCGCLHSAREVFTTVIQRDCVSWNSMVTACASNGKVLEASELLEEMSQVDNLKPSIVTWSAAIAGCAQNCYDEEVLALLRQMLAARTEPNARTLASLLPSCARLHDLCIGKEIHGYVTRHEYMSNMFVVNGLVDVYRRCGQMKEAWKIFTKYSRKNLISYNTMIVGYCENGKMVKAKELFDQMEIVGVAKDTISWNSMISGYVDNEQFVEALKMFRDMQMEEGIDADSFTLGSVLSACAEIAALKEGKEIHSFAIARGLHSNAFVGGALIEMYSKCHDLEAAQKAFDEVIERDSATWNVLISGYANCNKIEHVHMLLDRMKMDELDPNIYTWNGIMTGYAENGHNELVLKLFFKLQNECPKPDIYTIGIALHACSCLATIERGKQIHACSIRSGYDTVVHIGATLVDMYAKCGSIRHAMIAFERISEHNLVSWNTMLAGYAMHGHEKEGISLFHQMQQGGIMPDEITFLSVLTLCSHAGLVNEGLEYFNSMENLGIKHSLKHYTCVIDLVSRAGRLSEAYDIIKHMELEPDAVTWGSLLSGCVIHGDMWLGELAANQLIELDGSDSGNYVLLGNLYALAGRWDDLARTRQVIKDKGIQKSPGCSWIEGRDQAHMFVASDRSHKQTNEIYAALETLKWEMRKGGMDQSSFLALP